MFKVKIGREQVLNINNSNARSWYNVKVYKSSPFYLAANARIRNFYYRNLGGSLNNEELLVRKTTLIQTLPQYYGQYDVSLDVMPRSTISGWANILHVTKGGNNGFGDRMPGIWFISKSHRLYICASIGNNANHCVSQTSNLPALTYTNIRVTQNVDESCKKYRYKIFINGTLIHAVDNGNPLALQNVRVYLSDPWHNAANAFVKNLRVTTSQGDGFLVTKSNLFARYQRLKLQWYISFDIKPINTNQHTTNIIHMTVGDNAKNYGSRTPIVGFLSGSTRIFICSAINGNKDNCWVSSQGLSLHVFSNIQIRQTWDALQNKYVFFVFINGKKKLVKENYSPVVFNNVVLYASDPWHHPAQAIVKNLIFQNLPNGYTYGDCNQKRSSNVSCNSYASIKSFRTVDGECNNLHNPSWGATNIPLKRVVDAAYAEDGKQDTPRGFPGTLPLPNAVSQQLFKVETTTFSNSFNLTTLFMTFGQFLDHDITFTPHSSCQEKSCGKFNAWQYPCFPLLFDKSSTECSPNGRSQAVCSSQAYISPRQQQNRLSAFVDASQIYSSDKKQFPRLRTHRDGKLKLQNNELLPFDKPAYPQPDRCTTKGGCSLFGDVRGDENIALHSMHTLWVREHNRIASELKKLNPSWNDELLFQTSRKITSSIWQHITYNEYVPFLTSLPSYKGYNFNVDPSILNVFSTAAFRYGHSLVPNEFVQLDNNFDEQYKPISLQEAFFNREPINNRGIEPTMRGLIGNMSRDVDNEFAFGIARKLFVKVGSDDYLDLAALNVQRGRDHGLPGYNKYREFCGLPVADNWDDIGDFMLPGVAAKLQAVYSSPDDIDIFVGGISEKHDSLSEVGPTFECIINQQFSALRDGDRFYYENPGVLDAAQLYAIKKVTMSTILCNNLHSIVSIQPKAFQTPEGSNFRRSCCNHIPQLDLSPWKALSSNDMLNDPPAHDFDLLKNDFIFDDQDSESSKNRSNVEKGPSDLTTNEYTAEGYHVSYQQVEGNTTGENVAGDDLILNDEPEANVESLNTNFNEKNENLQPPVEVNSSENFHKPQEHQPQERQEHALTKPETQLLERFEEFLQHQKPQENADERKDKIKDKEEIESERLKEDFEKDF